MLIVSVTDNSLLYNPKRPTSLGGGAYLKPEFFPSEKGSHSHNSELSLFYELSCGFSRRHW